MVLMSLIAIGGLEHPRAMFQATTAPGPLPSAHIFSRGLRLVRLTPSHYVGRDYFPIRPAIPDRKADGEEGERREQHAQAELKAGACNLGLRRGVGRNAHMRNAQEVELSQPERARFYRRRGNRD